MNLDSLSFALSQISYSVANLTKKNYKSSVQEISHLITQHGAEADRHLFRCLFSHVDFSGDGKSSGKDFHQTQYLNQECASLITKPNFVSILCYSVDYPLHHQKSLKSSPHLFSQLSKVLKLTGVQEVAFALALQQSRNPDTRQHAVQYISSKLPPLIASYTDSDTSRAESGLTDIAIEVLHLVLSSLLHGKHGLGVSADQKTAFLDKLKADFPPDRVPVVLAPLLYPDGKDFSVENLNTNPSQSVPKSIMDASSLADIIRELGYIFTSSIEECRNSLVRYGVRELTPAAVARTLGVMAQHPQGLADPIAMQSAAGGGGGGSPWSTTDTKDKTDNAPNTWNVEIFVQVLKEIVPHLNWTDVVSELDHPGFVISSKAGLRLIVVALFRGLQDMFPINLLYRPWKNSEGQLSWITQSLANPDVFCFAEHGYHPVTIDILKSPPDEENRDILTWKSLDLVETLLRLAEAGHYQNVTDLFKFPHQNCPDMLVLALLQIPNWNTLKHELLSSLMPIFLDNHANSAIVLHYAWHCQGQSTTIRTLVMHAMAEWYMRGGGEHGGDQSRLSRILDVAQDLKALSMLLNATPFAFVIDLACLASRREYLKLEKWLADKIREHGEPFIQACVHFLKRRCPHLLQAGGKDDALPAMKGAQLLPDTLTTMLQTLHQHANGVSQELQESIMKMLMNKARMPPSGAVVPGQAVKPQTAPPAGLPPGPLPGSIGGLPPTPTPTNSSLAARMPIVDRFSQLGGGPPLPNPVTGTSSPLNLASQTPGSPAKSFPIGPASSQQQQQQSGFNPIQSLTSQLQGLGMESSLSVGLANTSAPPPLGSLNKPPPQVAPPQQRPTSQPGASLLSSVTSSAGPTPGSVQAPPTAATGAGGTDVSSIFPAVNQQFSKEIEDEANSYFQRIYNNTPHPTNISIDEVLDMLKMFKDSPMKKEREVFACMLRNLFEEYRFFPQYPDRELQTTAVLFGGIIEQGLVTYMDLGIALRYVLEALKKANNSKMYVFGITALDRFKTRLKDYPQYCQHLAGIGHFGQFPAHLQEYVEYGARSQEPPNRPQGPVTAPPPPQSVQPPPNMAPQQPPPQQQQIVVPTPAQPAPGTPATNTATTSSASSAAAAPGHGAIARPAGTRHGPSIATATNIDTLLAGQENDEVPVPPESLQDKVFFIFNNLSLSNMEQKSSEMMENIGEEYVPWMARYMVMKRASMEHNFHNLYAKFIDHLTKYNDFLALVVKETYRNIKVLLCSDKGVANFSDRSLLKNLGHWLGMLTLARNKPILYLDIDLKSLLYEAYHKGSQELLYVVPFVAKVLESCAPSKVFRPPNPWTMALMNVLAELHQEPDLKLNLKFEIEVLCKNLNLDVNDLTPGAYLTSIERLNIMEHQLSAPKKMPDSSTPQPDEPLQINMPTPTTAMMTTPTSNSAAGGVLGGGVGAGGVGLGGVGVGQAGMAGGQGQGLPAAGGAVSTAGTAGQAAAGGGIMAPQPQFGYHEINVMSFAGLTPHITINEQLPIFQAQPQFKQFVRQAIERAVQEFLPPVVERSIKIALTTCEQIVKKDFALDPEESRMRSAAHHMVRFMTAGMALIACREPLLVSISTSIKQLLLSTLRGATAAQKESIEQAATVIGNDNVELACAFIQKTAVEKAIPEMDKRLATEYELRKHARADNRRYCDPVVLTYQAERMPEQIRLKVGNVTHQQIAVYEEFARNIPGFLPSPQEVGGAGSGLSAGLGAGGMGAAAAGFRLGGQMQVPGFATDDITEIYNKIGREIEGQIRCIMAPPTNPQVVSLHKLLDAVILARNSREVVTAHSLLQKAVEGLLDGLQALPADADLMARYRDCHLLVLKGLQDVRAYGPQWTNKNVTRCLIECREEYKYNIEAVDCLLRNRLVHMQQYDVHLAQSMENGLNYMAVAFAMQLVQRFCVDDSSKQQQQAATLEADFYNTIETLARIAAHSRQAPEGLTALIDTIRQQHGEGGGLLDRAPGGPTSMMHSGISQAREFDDPPGLHEKTEFLLREWVTMYHSPAAGRDSTKAFSAFVGQMHQQGILKTDDLITRFFRLCTEMCVDLCYRALSEQITSPTLVRAKCFHTLDAFVRLIALLVKHSGDTTNTVTKINLLNKVLGIVAGVLLQDHEVRHNEFQQLPYHRIFIMLFIELNAPEHVLESINFQVLTAFCNTLHILRPAKAPGFAYAWLELVSHRVFIGRMLAITPQQRGWSMYAQLLIDLFKFLAPFLRNAELTKPMHLLYKGTLRVLLVLLHDFPEFLCDYHYAFCDVIPCNCIQLRNLILSAYPRQMRLPDPVTPNLKVDMLQEISHPPRIMTNFANMIQPATFKNDLDSYLKTRSPVTFLSELRSNLQISSEPGNRHNIPLMNALVLYVGTQAISHIHSKGLTPSMSTIAHSAHMDIFQNLAVDLDTEGRYLFLNAIANQLRYPNSHTHYFSCTLLYLFAESNTEAIQEQITRVLLERLIVNRPHPWGLLITFIELLKNPQFKFWNHEFVHCAPEIEKLFECVGRTFIQPRPNNLRENEVSAMV